MSEQFDEQGNSFETDDVEAHRIRAERNRSDMEVQDDTEGHRAAMLDGADEDTEGHKAGIESADEDDVEGHKVPFVQPRRDTDNQGNQF